MKTPIQKRSILERGLIVLACLFTICTTISCNDEDTESSDSYYVRYVIRGNGAYGRFSNWSASTPQGNYTNNGVQVTSWTQTYGPVRRGFNCRVQIGSYINGAPTIEILVSKNDEPFALKLSRTGNSASYNINF